MVQAGAPEEILYDHRPHVGTANLVAVVVKLREKIVSCGGEYRFDSKVVDLLIEAGNVTGVRLQTGEEIQSSCVLLAIGHSARDTFEMLLQKDIQLSPKPFSAGFRIEHPQILIDQAQYGKHAGHSSLGAADYQLSYKTSTGRAVYSFCMCPGGSVIGSSSEPGMVVTNGMSQYARKETNANSAIVAEVYPADYGMGALDGIHYQRKWEKAAYLAGGGSYRAPVQLVGDFLNNQATTELGDVKPSYQPGIRFGDLTQILPAKIVMAIAEALPEFGKRISGFAMHDAVLTAVETRTSSPVRILRGSDYQCISVRGLYPIGEGSGYAGGIMSSALDGIKAAEQLVEHWNNTPNS
jgi:uncharacterized FAD-dependent dehydrogenase